MGTGGERVGGWACRRVGEWEGIGAVSDNIADLHFRTDWFHWLMEQALSYDLVCIAGDLLDMFNVESPKGQAREVSMLIRELADIVPVAICSGNHNKRWRTRIVLHHVPPKSGPGVSGEEREACRPSAYLLARLLCFRT